MSQERVYQALAAQKGGYLSGQQLSTQLGITRAAVWKAVEGLRRSGYDIEARSGLGYRLVGLSDRVGLREIASFLAAPRAQIHTFDTVDSTNTACKRLAMEGAPDGTVAVADQQSAGRGRLGRSFQSPEGLGLYLSILWRPVCQPQQLLPLTALSAVAVRRAVKRVTGGEMGIKWPNDLVCGRKKIGGILTEMAVEGETGAIDYVVVGIGINCHHKASDFDGEVADMASSIDAQWDMTVCRPQLAAALIEELDTLRRAILFAPEKWLEDYRAACMTVGNTVQLLRGEERTVAQAIGVDEQFGLRVRHEDGREEILRSGEVSVRGMYGYV